MRGVILFLHIILLIAVLLHGSCATQSKRPRKPVTAIKVKPSGQKPIVGVELNLSTKTKLRGGTLKEVEVFVNGESVLKSKELENSVKIETESYKPGILSIKVVAESSDGIKGENYKSVELLSNLTPIKYNFEVVNSFQHNTDFFTQGLVVHNGILYEGTGSGNEQKISGIYKVELETGKTLKKLELDKKYWGEGIDILNGKIYQLTYKSQKGFVYDLKTFEKLDSWSYKTKEGWGLTNDGKNLIMSDGSEILRFVDPESLRELYTISVYNHKGPVKYINELEYIKGEIWANVWTTNMIIRIAPESGKVLGEIDLSSLGVMFQGGEKHIDVLNGIAWDKEKDRIFVTGKLWPRMFEIKVSAN